MKHFLLTIILTTASYSLCIAQEKEPIDFSFALRGKIFGFFVFEDIYFTTGTIGGEFLLGKKHSIGIDYTYFAWQYQTDGDFKDSCGNNINDVPLYDQYTRRPYFLIDYKYNLHTHGDNFSVYLNLYNKYGNYREWYDQDYNSNYFNTKPSILDNTIKGKFNELGAGIGFKSYINDSYFGYDMSCNYGYRVNNNNITIPSLGVYDLNQKTTRHLLYIRINFFYHFD